MEIFFKRPRTGGQIMGTLLAAGALGALISMGIFRAIDSLIRNQNLVAASGNIQIMKAQIQGMLSSAELCPLLFWDKNGSKAKINVNSSLSGNHTPAQLQQYQKENTLYHIGLKSLSLSTTGNFQNGILITEQAIAEVDPALRTTGSFMGIPTLKTLAQLWIQGEKKLAPNSPGIPFSLRFPLFIETDASSTSTQYHLLNCSSSGETARTPASPPVLGSSWVDAQCIEVTNIDTRMTYCRKFKNNQSPDEICRAAGFSRATGRCYTDVSYGTGHPGDIYYGSLNASNYVYDSVYIHGQWAAFCFFYASFERAPTRIGCE